MSSELRQSLRRLKPDKHRKTLSRRPRAELRFVSDLNPPLPKLLLDTTVYIDFLKGRLSEQTLAILQTGSPWHSTVTEAELSALAGLLDPVQADTAPAVAEVAASIDARPTHRVLNPDRTTWREAGILAGLLARLQHYGKSERRRALNDALIFLSAAKNGCVVLTRNVADFDLLMQLDSRGQAIFYEAQ